MSEQPFMTIRVTVEMRLYKGRLLEDLNNPENYRIAIYDQFSRILKFHDTLRDGEYIDLLFVEQVDP
jgi:hypothetical protein